jgi:hypothetical protein
MTLRERQGSLLILAGHAQQHDMVYKLVLWIAEASAMSGNSLKYSSM